MYPCRPPHEEHVPESSIRRCAPPDPPRLRTGPPHSGQSQRSFLAAARLNPVVAAAPAIAIGLRSRCVFLTASTGRLQKGQNPLFTFIACH